MERLILKEKVLFFGSLVFLWVVTPVWGQGRNSECSHCYEVSKEAVDLAIDVYGIAASEFVPNGELPNTYHLKPALAAAFMQLENLEHLIHEVSCSVSMNPMSVSSRSPISVSFRWAEVNSPDFSSPSRVFRLDPRDEAYSGNPSNWSGHQPSDLREVIRNWGNGFAFSKTANEYSSCYYGYQAATRWVYDKYCPGFDPNLGFGNPPDIANACYQRLADLAGEDLDRFQGSFETYSACFQSTTEKAHEFLKEFYQNFQDKPLEEIEALFKAENQASLQGFPKEDIAPALLAFKVLMSDGKESAFQSLRSDGSKLSSNQKVTFLQMVGDVLYEGYDNARRDAGTSAKGSVDIDEMLNAARNRENLGLDFDQYGDNFAGVCRDISSAQGKMAEELGFKKVYVIAHATDNIDMHTTLYLEDPEVKGKPYLLNYGIRKDGEGITGSSALNQDWQTSNLALAYRVYKPYGEQLREIPSDLNLAITEALRGRRAVEERFPGYVSRGNFLSVSADVPRVGNLRIYSTRDNSGRLFFGAGRVFNSSSEGGHFSQESGVALNWIRGHDVKNLSGASESGADRTSVRVDSRQIYAFNESKLRFPTIQIGEERETRIGFEAAAIAEVILAHNSYQAQSYSSWLIDGSIRPRVGVNVSSTSETGRLQTEASARVEGAIGVSQISDPWSTLGLRFDRMVLDGKALYKLTRTEEGREELSETPEGRAYLYGHFVSVVDHWGPTLISTTGLRLNQHEVSLQVQGDLSGGRAPLFKEGATRQIGATYRRYLSRDRGSLEATFVVPKWASPFVQFGGRFQVGSPR